MRIAFSITYYDPYVSGLTICAKRIAEGLVARGHTVQVVAMRHKSTLVIDDVIGGVHVRRVKPDISLSKGFLSWRWMIEMWKVTQRSDVVVVHLPQLEGILTALVAKLQKKRLVSVYHCEIVLPPGFVHRVIQWGIECAHTVTLMMSDKVVTYTDDYAQSSRLLNIVANKVQAILPPIPIPHIDTKIVKSLRGRIAAPPNSIFIGISSRLAAEKGIEYMLAALPEVQRAFQHPVRLLIAGPMEPVGESKYKDTIISMVKSVEDQVVFLGTLTQEEIGSFYSLLDVLVLPSVNKTEAFGMVQVEAMLCGVPVVASDLPGVRIPIQKTDMGVCIPIQDSTSLSQAIISVVKYKKKFQKNQQIIQKIFSLSESISAYEHLLAASVKKE